MTVSGVFWVLPGARDAVQVTANMSSVAAGSGAADSRCPDHQDTVLHQADATTCCTIVR